MTNSALLLQTVVNWLMLIGIYALMALGITLIFSVMGIIDFAYGQALMLGAFGTVLATTYLGVPYVVAVALAFIAVGVSSSAMERVLFRPLRGEPNATLLMTFALALLLQGGAQLFAGAGWLNLQLPVSGSWFVFGVYIIKTRFVISIGCAIAIGLLFAFLRWTMLGNAMRAIAQDREGAVLQGIAVDRMFMFGFGIGSGLAAFAGGLLALLAPVYAAMGTDWLLKAFIVIVVGGLGSVRGAVAGAVVIAFIDSFGTLALGSGVQLLGYGMVIAILIVRPRGLLLSRA
jgi:branched-chain amino acid transport system permease protein